jgi:hypothetical protein
MNAKTRDSCRELFKDLKILPVHSQYIFSISLFVIKNEDQYNSYQEIHSINTRCSTNLHLPTSSLAVYQRGAYYYGIRVFNHSSSNIKTLSNEVRLFQLSLKWFLLIHFIPYMNTLIVIGHRDMSDDNLNYKLKHVSMHILNKIYSNICFCLHWIYSRFIMLTAITVGF